MTFDRQGGEVRVRAADQFRSREPLIGAERPKPRIVADQHVRPTAVPDLTDPIVSVLERIRATGWHLAHRGVFHAAETGFTNLPRLRLSNLRRGPQTGPACAADRHRRLPDQGDAPGRRAARHRQDRVRLRGAMPLWEVGLARVIRALHAV